MQGWQRFAAPSTSVDVAVAAVLFGVAIWFLVRRWPPGSARAAWATGALWALLTVAFELALARWEGQPWAAVLDAYALWRGSLWPLLVGWILAAPRALSAVQGSGVAAGRTLGWAVATWGACGLTFAITRGAAGVDAAIAVHLAAAPLIGAAATRLLWRRPGHPGVAATALTLAATAALLDAIVVAPFLERSYAMFASMAGTWIPLALVLAASAGTGARLAARATRGPLASGGVGPHSERRQRAAGRR